MATPKATSGSDWPSGGGRDGGWRALLSLTVPSMCWEFLRRNQTYQEHFRTLRHGAATSGSSLGPRRASRPRTSL
ncbi:transcriptional regulator domain-containing protein [Caulobacter sp. UC70_42]|uniref:transcriptional regulator domain-containing protein n=1 Tax=Caulobacter sp. UC70_42 TaxID=3374551 RepID=UPI00375792FD